MYIYESLGCKPDKLTQHYKSTILQQKIQCGRTSHWSEWLLSKSRQTVSAGEGVQKNGPCYTADWNINWCNYYRKQYGGSLKN